MPRPDRQHVPPQVFNKIRTSFRQKQIIRLVGDSPGQTRLFINYQLTGTRRPPAPEERTISKTLSYLTKRGIILNLTPTLHGLPYHYLHSPQTRFDIRIARYFLVPAGELFALTNLSPAYLTKTYMEANDEAGYPNTSTGYDFRRLPLEELYRRFYQPH